MIELRYGMLCDYGTIGNNGKAIAVHIFDNFIRPAGGAARPLPPFHILAKLECSIADGSQHELLALIVDEDHRELARFPMLRHEFGAQGPGLPLASQLLIHVNGLVLSRIGAYQILLQANGTRIGCIDFRVTQVTPTVV